MSDRTPPQNAAEARRAHRSEGFRRYRGPKLVGRRHEIHIGEPNYPSSLLVVPRPPSMLYAIGDPSALEECLAIVGARKATPYGLSCAQTFARMAAEAGVCVVSGGARGCDSRAHQAALEAGGRTVVVLGGGCDEVYPSENFPLFQRAIDQGGAVVSENPWDYPPLRHTFRERNRLIAGLAPMTLIVEAGLPSGTFSTADFALSCGRDVAAVPGAITSTASRGCNRLIAQGAIPIVDRESFADALFMSYGRLKREEPDEPERQAWAETPLGRMLCAHPSTFAEIKDSIDAGEVDVTMARAMALIAQWQAEGSIVAFPDGRFGVPVR